MERVRLFIIVIITTIHPSMPPSSFRPETLSMFLVYHHMTYPVTFSVLGWCETLLANEYADAEYDGRVS